MQGIAIALLSEDRDRLVALQHRVEGTTLGRTVFSHAGFPASGTDPILRQIQDLRAEVVLVDIDPQRTQRAISLLELLESNTNDLAIFAVGDMTHPPTIVAVMRAGACEYLERVGDATSLQEALGRFASSRTRRLNSVGRARVFTFMNAKGGSGATTIAVNTAIALQENHGAAVLVDFASLGHASLHLNVRPIFGLTDALQNLHRMDAALLKGFMTVCKKDLHLLAGASQVVPMAPTAAELARLFDLLVTHYRYVIVDCSSRTDEISRMLADLSHQVMLVAQTDVVALWSSGRMHAWFDETGSREKVQLVLNRYKKIPGFSDEDMQKATSCRVLWKVPNHYHSVAAGIDRGEPVMLQDNEISRSIRGLAAVLAEAESAAQDGGQTVEDRSEARKKTGARLLISPASAGQ
jgi:pilus assembly protein CpaE